MKPINQLKKLFSLFVVCYGLLSGVAIAQERFGGTVSNNTTSFPVTGYGTLFHSQFHPGADLFWELKLNKKVHNQFWFKVDFGGYYHRFFQTAFRIQPNINYRLAISPCFAFDLALGGGYLHSFTEYSRFKLNDTGQYVKVSAVSGRPQYIAGFMIGANIGLIKASPDKIRLLLQFRTLMQGPFAKSYVPLLPLNSFALGLSFPLKSKEVKSNE